MSGICNVPGAPNVYGACGSSIALGASHTALPGRYTIVGGCCNTVIGCGPFFPGMEKNPTMRIVTVTNKDRIRKIRDKKEKIEPEQEEVKPSPVFEMALRIARNSFYGILGIKVEGTKTPEVSGRIKKIK